MTIWRRAAITICIVISLSSVASSRLYAGPPPQSSQTEADDFRLVRSVSGAAGVLQVDQFVIQDPRQVFHVPDDKLVYVLFEWEGPMGSHHLQGSWKDPSGKTVLVANIDSVAKTSRFSAYWALTLTPGIAPGLWALEVQIDGQPAGTHSFQVVSGTHTTPPLETDKIYKQALAASVFINSFDREGSLLNKGAGFFVTDKIVLTAFQNVNGAHSLSVQLPDGTQSPANEILAWNRLEDWAMVKVEYPKTRPLERAAPGSWSVGDTCYVIDSPDEDSRSIQAVSISGIRESKLLGQRLDLSWSGWARSAGSPVLDSYGHVIGILGGSVIPGSESVHRPGSKPYKMDLLVTPISLVPASVTGTPATLTDLSAKNQFIVPLPRDTSVYAASMGKDYVKLSTEAARIVDSTEEFSGKLDAFAVVVTWAPKKKIKSTTQMVIYNLENILVAKAPASKLDLQPGESAFSAWKVSLNSLAAGEYRVEVVVGDEPQWRSFFKISGE